ncbi:MAG: hypothetical protein ACE5I7_19280 [Candidatus Binatia bacterium]
MPIDFDATYHVDGWEGIAFHAIRMETEPDEDTVWSGFENETGRVVVRMVGDDRDFAVEVEDLTPLPEEDYCSGCGQIGCGW